MTASSRPWRSSARRSRSPTHGRRASRSSPSRVAGRMLSASMPSRHTTRAGTLRSGTRPVSSTSPDRVRSRPRAVPSAPSRTAATSRTSRATSVTAAADHRLLAERVDRPGDRRQLPCLVGRDRAGGAEHGGEALGPLVDAVATGEQAAGAAQAAHQLGEPTGTAHVVGGDVVEGLHPSRIGRGEIARRRRDRGAEQQSVDACRPGALGDVGLEPLVALAGVESPAGAQLVDPPPEPLEVGGREREHAAHRCERGEVEHVDGGAPAGQRGDDGAERGRHRVLRAEREIADRDRHRQPAAAEDGRRERREAPDVGAHHEHVSRFERRIGDEAGVEGVAEGVELAQRAMARVHLHGAVGGAGERGGRAVLDDVALEVAQQGGRQPRRRRTAARRRPRRRGRGRGRLSRAPNAPTSARGDVRRGRRRRRRRAGGRPGVAGRAAGSAPRSPATGTPRTRRHRGPCRGRRARRAGRPTGRWCRTVRRAPGPPARAARPAGRPAAARGARRGGPRRCARARRGTARTATSSRRRAGRPARGRRSPCRPRVCPPPTAPARWAGWWRTGRRGRRCGGPRRTDGVGRSAWPSSNRAR